MDWLGWIVGAALMFSGFITGGVWAEAESEGRLDLASFAKWIGPAQIVVGALLWRAA